ncbi:MAG: PIN-like domain-containing protein [Chloroflexota bacterium]
MKLFVDEDTGAGLGRALAAVGVQARYVAKDMPIVPGTKDEHWIPWAGREGSLVLSRNTAILEAEAQRSLLIVCGVGIVFLPQHLSSFSLLRLILKKWEWLERWTPRSPDPLPSEWPPAAEPLYSAFPAPLSKRWTARRRQRTAILRTCRRCSPPRCRCGSAGSPHPAAAPPRAG